MDKKVVDDFVGSFPFAIKIYIEFYKTKNI